MVDVPCDYPIADVSARNRKEDEGKRMTGINSTGQISVGTSATSIVGTNALREGVLITNTSASATVYLGGPNVTTATGQALLPNQSITLPVVSPVYGVVASSTVTISYLEVQ